MIAAGKDTAVVRISCKTGIIWNKRIKSVKLVEQIGEK